MKEKILEPIDIIISQTNLKGNIIYVNKVLCKISGYSIDEVVGKDHNILIHPNMPKAIFKYIEEKLNSKEEVYSFIKNRTKDESYYWIFSHIYPTFNRDGEVRNYISTSHPISTKAKEIIEELYRDLLLVEKHEGVNSSINLFKKFIDINRYKKTQSNNEVICNIQY